MTRTQTPKGKRRRRRNTATTAAPPPLRYADPSEIVEEVDHQADHQADDDDYEDDDGDEPGASLGQTVAELLFGAAIGSVFTLGAVALGRHFGASRARPAPPPWPRRPALSPEEIARLKAAHDAWTRYAETQRRHYEQRASTSPPPPRPSWAPPPPPPRTSWTPPASSWAPPPPPPPPPTPPCLDEDAAAAALLGVSLMASEDEIRAAHKRIVRERMQSAGFGDTAADQTETIRINAARQRLIERAKKRGGVS